MYRGKYSFKKKRSVFILPGILLAFFLPLLVITSFDAAMAYMYKQSDEVTNKLEMATVSVDVEETFDGTTKSNVYIRNTSNIPVYIRATIVEYWKKDGVYVPKPEGGVVIIDKLGDGWLKVGDVYFYPNQVAVNGETSNLIDKVTVTMPEGYTYHMDIYAEAIQAHPKDAVQDAWGVYVGTDGELTTTAPVNP